MGGAYYAGGPFVARAKKTNTAADSAMGKQRRFFGLYEE